uniref:Si:zfos-943e10.1 n=1 Tax=Tetraodon nigroviridis TaxID=99883 RepID=H3CXI8_TETNG
TDTFFLYKRYSVVWPATLAEGRMLENKRERLKTFLRKIDEKAVIRIKHLMKESYPVESSGGGLPAKAKKSRISNGSIKKLEARKALSLEAAQLEIQEQHKTLTRQAAIRSQTFSDPTSLEKTESTGTNTSFIKHKKTFQQLFPEIGKEEELIHSYVCALQKEVPYHGRLYVTEAHACFHSSVLLKDTKVVIPLSSIHTVKKHNMALLVRNALSVRTSGGDKYLFLSLRNRESCFQLLRSLCPQIEDGSANSSPVFSSAENSFDKSKPVVGGLLPLLDPPPTVRSAHTRDIVPSAPLQNTSLSSLDESLDQFASGGSWAWSVTEKAKSLLVQREASTINTLLFIYLILAVLLLLSSGYIGLRIVALEEQLTSLGALPEFTLRSGCHQDT